MPAVTPKNLEALSNPQLLPWSLSEARIQFLDLGPAARERISEAVFLASPWIEPGRDGELVEVPLGIKELEPILQPLLERALAHPPPLLLHSGYCGSTLLCRFLDLPSRALPLREPRPLSEQTSGLLSTGDPGPMRTALALLARPYPADEPRLIKPNSRTCLATSLFAFRGSRIVYLMPPAPEHLCSCLNNPSRRQWARRSVRLYWSHPLYRGWTSLLEDPGTADARIIAATWLLHRLNLHDLLAAGQSVMAISTPQLVHRPVPTLLETAEFLGLDLPSAAVAEHVRRHSGRHSKRQDGFDARTRVALQMERELRFKAELKIGLSWLEKSAARLEQTGMPPTALL